MSYAVVIVLHRSRARARAAARPRSTPAAADRRRHRPRRRRRGSSRASTARTSSSAATTRASAPPTTSALEHVTQPVTVLLNPDIDRLTATRSAARARRRPACTRRACSTPTAASSAARTRSRARSAPSCPPLSPLRAHAERSPYQATHAAHRRVGGRRRLAARTETLRQLGPFDPRHPPLRRGHGPVPAGARAGHPDDPAPRPRRSPTPAATASTSEPFELLARQRREVDASAAAAARAQRRDDAAQLLTFATRALAKAPHNDRERAQLDALLEGCSVSRAACA